MSARTKIKQKVVKATLANKDVLDMFNGIVGNSEGAASLAITCPKYHRIRNHVGRFIKLLTVLRDSNLMKLFPGPQDHLRGYVRARRAGIPQRCASDQSPTRRVRDRGSTRRRPKEPRGARCRDDRRGA